MSLATRLAALATAIATTIKPMIPRLLPSGGDSLWVLSKGSAADYDVVWVPSANIPVSSAVVVVPNNTCEYEATWPDAGVANFTHYIAWLQPTGEAFENEPHMVGLHNIITTPGAGEITFHLQFAEPQSGLFLIGYKAL